MADFFGFKITTSKKQKVLFDYANTTPVYILLLLLLYIYIYKIQLRSLPILRKQNCVKILKQSRKQTPKLLPLQEY